MTESTRLILWDAQSLFWTAALIVAALSIPLISIKMAVREARHLLGGRTDYRGAVSSGFVRVLKDSIATRPKARRSVLSSARAFEIGCCH
ncbi:hypothetical protein [Methylocapsa palsarum]|uniref:Uncharacterized protein n=1 Tax=Methylocapsa palsarum TaxID=1612308 RepID=A0A1I3YQ10_9HYPH|nr:hypothetical protein [Methylocapsa palsarum]SFK34027.1 hypothetical protein SAMN05444581_106100 [Methylocapsa palsarum]